MSGKRCIIALRNILPDDEDYDYEQDATDLVEAHHETFTDSDWTLQDDKEMEIYAKNMARICRKKQDSNNSPSNQRLYLNVNEGPQYVTRAALLFLQVMYKDCPMLAAFQRAAGEYGFAAPDENGFHKQGRNRTTREAPEGWLADEKITKHYDEVVSQARKTPSKKSPLKKTAPKKTTSRTSTPAAVEDQMMSAEPRTEAVFKLTPVDDDEEAVADEDVDMAETTIVVATEANDTDDDEMQPAIPSPKKRPRPDDIETTSFTTANAQGTPSPEKRRKMPEILDRPAKEHPLPQLPSVKSQLASKQTPKVDVKMLKLPPLSESFSDLLPKKRTLPEPPASKDKPVAEIDDGAPETPVKANKLPDLQRQKGGLPDFSARTTPDLPTTPMTEPVAKFANKLPGIKSKARASELPDLVLLDQIHAKKKDAHHAEMKKLTENITELTLGREKAEQEVSKMKNEMSRMEGEMEGRMESLVQQLEEAKEAQGQLEAYVRQLVNRLLEVGSLTG